MPHAGGLRVAVLGDSGATLYAQDDPHEERTRALGAQPFPELLAEVSSRPLEVVSLAAVAQQLRHGLAGPYDALPALAPDIVVLSHGGREAVIELPRRLRRLRCDPRGHTPRTGRRRLIHLVRRPLWRLLVVGFERAPRLTERLVRPLGVGAACDPSEFRDGLERSVRWIVEELGAPVVLLRWEPWFMSYWPWSRPVKAKNDAALLAVAASYGHRACVLDLADVVDAADFAADGVHLNPGGHRRVAVAVAAAIERTAAAKPLAAIG